MKVGWNNYFTTLFEFSDNPIDFSRKLCTRTRSLSRVILYKQNAQGLRGPGRIGCETFLVVGLLVGACFALQS
jgi:hypothetical protein